MKSVRQAVFCFSFELRFPLRLEVVAVKLVAHPTPADRSYWMAYLYFTLYYRLGCLGSLPIQTNCLSCLISPTYRIQSQIFCRYHHLVIQPPSPHCYSQRSVDPQLPCCSLSSVIGSERLATASDLSISGLSFICPIGLRLLSLELSCCLGLTSVCPSAFLFLSLVVSPFPFAWPCCATFLFPFLFLCFYFDLCRCPCLSYGLGLISLYPSALIYLDFDFTCLCVCLGFYPCDLSIYFFGLSLSYLSCFFDLSSGLCDRYPSIYLSGSCLCPFTYPYPYPVWNVHQIDLFFSSSILSSCVQTYFSFCFCFDFDPDSLISFCPYRYLHLMNLHRLSPRLSLPIPLPWFKLSLVSFEQRI